MADPVPMSLAEVIGKVADDDLSKANARWKQQEAERTRLRKEHDALSGQKTYNASELLAVLAEDAEEKLAPNMGLDGPDKKAENKDVTPKPNGFPPPPIKP